MKRRAFIIAIVVSLGLGITGSPEPMKSPLALVVDPLGAELQRTFISAPDELASKTRASFIAYRRTFDLGAVPHSARLHIFADARYVLWINGEPVHRGPNRFETRGPDAFTGLSA